VGVQSLIQSDFVGSSGRHNLEALIQDGSNMTHYYRDADSGNWGGPTATVSTSASGPASLILGDHIGGDGHRELEALILEGNDLNSYIRDNTGWHQLVTITTTATGPAAMTLSDFVNPSGYHNLEVLVPEGSNLNHYYRDNTGWHGPTATVTANATGPASLILGEHVGADGHRNLEALVPEGSNLNSYIRDDSGWHQTATITTAATGPASMTLSDFVNPANGYHNVEVIVPEGNNLRAYFRDEVHGTGWQGPTDTVTAAAGDAASLILGDYRDPDGHRDLEALVTKSNGSVQSYIRDAASVWHRTRFTEQHVIFWNRPAGGNWSVPGNWDLNRVPTAADDVVIDLHRTYTVNLDVNATVASFTLDAAGATFAVAGQTISTAGRADLDAGHVLLRNAHWQGTGTLNNLSDSASMVVEGNSFIDVPYYNSGHLQVHGNHDLGLHAKLTVATGFTNDGAIEVSSTGTADSTLAVTNGSLINMPGATIDMLAPPDDWNTGGKRVLDLELDNRGTVTAVGNPYAAHYIDLDTPSTVHHHSNSGTINVSNTPGFSVSLHAGSTFDFSGTLNVGEHVIVYIVNQGPNPGTFYWHAGTTMSGPGQLGLLGLNVSLQGDVSTSPGFGNVALVGGTVNGPGTLTNSSGASLGLGQNEIINTPLLNQGYLGVLSGRINGPLTTDATSTLSMSHVESGTLTVANGFTNHGIIRLTSDYDNGPATLEVTNGVLVNAADGRIETLVGAHGGPRTLAAALDNQGTVNINVNTTLAGSLSNSGTLTIGPGATLTVSDNYTQGSAGTLDVQLGGSPASGQFGKLAVSGTATLAGTLQVDLVNGYGGNLGDVFTILTFGSRTGDFDNFNLPPGAIWDPNAGTARF
jgi:hypothetical protein